MKYLLTPVVLALSIGAGWLVYRDSLNQVAAKPTPGRKEPLAVRVVRIASGTVEDRVELVGEIAPASEFQVRSRISGYILRMPAAEQAATPARRDEAVAQNEPAGTTGTPADDSFARQAAPPADLEANEEPAAGPAPAEATEEHPSGTARPRGPQLDVGDFVQQGQLVVELESSSFREAVIRAEAEWNVARAQLRARIAEQNQAQKELDRQILLGKSGVVTNQQREEAEAAVAIATAQVELEKANVARADSERSQAAISLEETRILAGQSGHVAERFAGVGDLAAPTDPLLRIVNIDTVQTVVRVAERDYPRVEAGQEASIFVDAWPNREFRGTVVRKSPVLDPETRTGELQVEIPNEGYRLRPGMHAKVSIILERHSSVPLVPLAALIGRAEEQHVYSVRGTPAKTWKTAITTGISDGTMIEVLSGLESGSLVVTLGNRLVSDGQEVTVVEPAAAAGTPATEEKEPAVVESPVAGTPGSGTAQPQTPQPASP